MARYTVHVSQTAASQLAELEGAIFVRDGWSWSAFAFGPLWLLWHRHWVTGVPGLIVQCFVLTGIFLSPVPDSAKFLAIFVLAMLWGLEAASMRRLDLAQSGMREEAALIGADRDIVEQRFFAAAAEAKRPASPAVPSAPPPEVPRGPWGAPVIGLFPEPRKPT